MAQSWWRKFDERIKELKDMFTHEDFEGMDNVMKTVASREGEPAKQKHPSKAITSINKAEIHSIFKLKRPSPGAGGLVLRPQDRRPLPNHLSALLADYDLALKGSPSNEGRARSKIDPVLFTTLASCKRAELNRIKSASSFESLSRYESVQFQHETELKLPWFYKKSRVTLTGKADYSLWYGDYEDQESNLLIVEAKREGGDGFYQVLAYMAMIHHARKKAGRRDTTVWGISTNGDKWEFVRLDADSTVKSVMYAFHNQQGPDIIGMLYLIINHAAGLASSISRTSSMGRKRTLEEACGIEITPS